MGRKYKQIFVNIYAGTKKRKHQERLNVYKSSINFAEFASKPGREEVWGKNSIVIITTVFSRVKFPVQGPTITSTGMRWCFHHTLPAHTRIGFLLIIKFMHLEKVHDGIYSCLANGIH